MRSLLALAALAIATAAVFLLAPSAKAAFGFKTLSLGFTEEDGTAATQAGSHPYAWTTRLALNTTGPAGEELPDGALKDLRIQLPPGLVGTPALLPRCTHIEYLVQACPAASEVGEIELEVSDDELEDLSFPLYNLEPLPGNAAELAFTAEGVSVVIVLRIATAPPHNLIAEITNASQAAAFFGSTLTIHGVPGSSPLLTLPRSCAPAAASFEADPWGEPGAWVSAAAPETLIPTGCGRLGFDPTLSVTPTTNAAHAPSGLDLSLELPDEGLTSPTGTAAADLAAADLALPPQMTLNPALAAGLGACNPAQLAAETPGSAPGEGCPESSKIGTAEVTTPLVGRPVSGTLYVATPDDPATTAPGAENPFDSLLGLYLVLRDPERGILLSLPIRVDADPATGRLTAHLGQIPQLPLSHLSLRFNSGPRAPLTTPTGCGEHAISYSLTPSSGNTPVEGEETFATTSNCGEGFGPELSAGTASNAAGSEAPFVLELRNAAGAPNLGGLDLTLPPGLAANLDMPTCPEAGTAAAACPADSRLGYARIAIGSGSEPLRVPAGAEPDSDVFLAGPYRGAPFSLLVSVPAAAGPFDLGRVVLRAAASIDPDSGQVSVELAGLPQIRDGIPLHYRAIRLVLDRSDFVRNPTSCEPMRIQLDATAADGASASASTPFQAADCGGLPFRPRLGLRLSGTLGRNGHPRVEAHLATRPGQANLSAATVDLPAGELLDTRHLRALCERALPPDRCPAASRLGWAAVRSPLLPEPLRGPIFLRTPSRRYPDLIAELKGGGVRIRIHGSTASAPDGRLRFRLSGLPDLPLARATLALAGGRRGIVVNSRGLCGRVHRLTALLSGQNGKKRHLRPHVGLNGRC